MTIKKNKTFKLDDATMKRLKRLSEKTGSSQAVLIENALYEYEKNFHSSQELFMELWRKLNEVEQALMIKRDTDPKTGIYHEGMTDEGEVVYNLTKEEDEVLEFYHEMWEKMRELPFFEQPGDE